MVGVAVELAESCEILGGEDRELGEIGLNAAEIEANGIGFLGAGAILHTKVHIVGLTTAAGLWVAAGVGLAIGSGMYVIGIGAGLLLFVLLQFAGPEEFIRQRRKCPL